MSQRLSLPYGDAADVGMTGELRCSLVVRGLPERAARERGSLAALSAARGQARAVERVQEPLRAEHEIGVRACAIEQHIRVAVALVVLAVEDPGDFLESGFGHARTVTPGSVTPALDEESRDSGDGSAALRVTM